MHHHTLINVCDGEPQGWVVHFSGFPALSGHPRKSGLAEQDAYSEEEGEDPNYL